MDILINVLTYIVSFSVTFPFIITFLIYIVSKRVTSNKIKALHKSVDLSTLFYVISTYFLMNKYVNFPLLSIIIVLLLIILSLIIIYQRRKYNDIYIVKAIKIIWRTCFLLFAISYFSFSIFGVLKLILY